MYPKQFQVLGGTHSLYQETLARLAELPECLQPVVVTNEEHRFIALEQAREQNRPLSAILLEPVGKNTAPAIAMAAHWAVQHAGDPLLLVCPADHVIKDLANFRKAVQFAVTAASAGRLVAFGIVPDSPQTGYGYIRADKNRPLSFVSSHLSVENRQSSLVRSHLSSTKDQGPMTKDGSPADQGQWTNDAVYPIVQFVEKPDLATAQAFLAEGSYYWNSGMFLFKASRYLEELALLHPEMGDSCKNAYEGAGADHEFVRIPTEAFSRCPADSIDYAVMEKTGSAAMVPLDAKWSDVGAWSAVWEICEKDPDGNVCTEDVLSIDCRNNYVSTAKITAMIGVDDLVVVDTADALLIMKRDRAQDVKKVVNALKAKGRTETNLHRKVYRPWGWYDSVDFGDRFQVKRIMVKPGATLSLQLHHHRAEHWIVVKGTARVTCGEKVTLLTENQSVFIPLGEQHRLENPGRVPLELIEVQSGPYLGEDDIVRFEDKYGR
jgi:mannose-1-phosphate guanylyltransferase/mannose-6-phosphate isomerase-like protein (cupin superfamily)